MFPCNLRTTHLRPLAFGMAMALTIWTPSIASAESCSLTYNLPGDISESVLDATDGTFAEFSWQTFLALNAPEVGGQISVNGDNPTQWAQWSSTADLLNLSASGLPPGPSGSRYYPPICRSVPDYEDYRAIHQVGKVDDSFQEAQTLGLSGQPVIDQNGNFVRYEILINPVLHDQVVREGLYHRDTLLGLQSDIELTCGEAGYSGGDPSNPGIGSMVVKAAWMDVTDLGESEVAAFHTEELLVSTPGYRNASRQPLCELKTMALVGLHVLRKTVSQPTWVWATWEHVNNAPDCLGQMPKGGSTNPACPTTFSESYSFDGPDCVTGDSCNACNTYFKAGNSPGTELFECVNPLAPGQCSDNHAACRVDGDCKTGATCLRMDWCLDLPPAPVAGTSQICRQVPLHSGSCSNDSQTICSDDSGCSGGGVCRPNYPASTEWNQNCHEAIAQAPGSGASVWKNYELIGAQWFTKELSTSCPNVQTEVYPAELPSSRVAKALISPQVQLSGPWPEPMVASADSRPVLGNTSMESYERANCMGCHSKVYLPGVCASDASQVCRVDLDCGDAGRCLQYSTDFMYWLNLEVANGPTLALSGRKLKLSRHVGAGKGKDSLRARADDPSAYVPSDGSSNDPRCNGDPEGTVKARLRLYDNAVGFDSGPMDLPCENWRAFKNNEGYRYNDSDGVCTKVRIRGASSRISIRCASDDLVSLVPVEGSDVTMSLSLGRVQYCVRFDNVTKKTKTVREIYVSKGGPAASICEPPLARLGPASP
jgi:hypothetical protein